MESAGRGLGSLAQQSRRKALGRAKGILWLVGVLTVLVNGFQLLNVEKEFEKAVGAELRREGVTLSEVRARPTEERAEFDEAYDKGLRLARVITVAGVVMGLCFIACALFVNRRPVAATVTGLVLFLGAWAATLALEPALALRGALIKVLIVIGLVSAVRAALAVERAEREGAQG